MASNLYGNKMGTADLRYDLMAVVDERKIPAGAQIFEAADKIAPPVSVERRDGHLPNLKAGDGDRLISGIRGADGSYPRFSWEMSDVSYFTEFRGWEMTIDNVEDYDANSIINLEQYHAEQLSDTRKVGKEYRVATAANAYASYAATNKQTITLAANNVVTGENLLVLGDTVAAALYPLIGVEKEMLSLIVGVEALRTIVRDLGDFKDNTVYTNPIMYAADLMTKANLLRDYLGVKEIIPVSGRYNQAHFKKDPNFGRLWSQTQLIYAVLSPGGSWDASFMRQPNYNKPLGGRDFVLETYDEPATDTSVTRLKESSGEYVNYKYAYCVEGIFAAGV